MKNKFLNIVFFNIFILSCNSRPAYKINTENFPNQSMMPSSIRDKQNENSDSITRTVSGKWSFSEFNKSKNQLTEFVGDTAIGFWRYLGYKGDDKTQETKFYANGKIRFDRFMYGRRVIKSKDNYYIIKEGNVSYPIGDASYFDSSGMLIKQIRWDTVFRFDIKKVKHTVSSLGIDWNKASITTATTTNYDNRYDFWVIWYEDKNFGRCLLRIDNKTGKILLNQKPFVPEN